MSIRVRVGPFFTPAATPRGLRSASTTLWSSRSWSACSRSCRSRGSFIPASSGPRRPAVVGGGLPRPGLCADLGSSLRLVDRVVAAGDPAPALDRFPVPVPVAFVEDLVTLAVFGVMEPRQNRAGRSSCSSSHRHWAAAALRCRVPVFRRSGPVATGDVRHCRRAPTGADTVQRFPERVDTEDAALPELDPHVVVTNRGIRVHGGRP